MRRLMWILAFMAVCGAGQPASAQYGTIFAVLNCGTGAPAVSAGSPSVLTVDITGKLCSAASVSASITGFAPASTGTPISVTTGGVTGTLPAGTVVVASNIGTTNNGYCKLGASATTADQLIAPNSWFAFTVGAATQLTCITSASTTTVNMVGGSGLPTGAGGGGGGGGGGGAITAASGSYASGAFSAGAGADGWDVGVGATTAAVATPGSVGSVNAKLRLMTTQLDTLNTNVTSAIPAGTNTIGNVGVVSSASGYETVAASQTAQVMGGSGAIGDYLSHCVIYPVTTGAGAVTVFDNANAAATNVITFTSGTLSNLAPIPIPVGALSTAGAWKVTTGANVTVVCYGKFT